MAGARLKETEDNIINMESLFSGFKAQYKMIAGLSNQSEVDLNALLKLEPKDFEAACKKIIDNPAAARLLKRDYRAPWQHPSKG